MVAVGGRLVQAEGSGLAMNGRALCGWKGCHELTITSSNKQTANIRWRGR